MGNQSNKLKGELKREGKNKYTDTDGTIYEGVFVNNKLNGKGTCTYSYGLIIEGIFVNGTLKGKGKMTTLNGTVYEGEFVNGVLNGQGVFADLNGYIHEGVFTCDQLSDGKIIKNNKLCSEGTYKNNKLVLGIQYVYDDGIVYKYDHNGARIDIPINEIQTNYQTKLN
jgi:hypothetical protein